MGTIACPVCGETGRIGLPRDATIESVGEEPPAERTPDYGMKTRQVRCQSGHEVYVTFRTEAAANLTQ